MNLAELQTLFQESVLAEAPSPRLLAELKPPARAKNIAEAFAVYHDGFRLRIAEYLESDYPILRQTLDDRVFESLVEAYWRARPSKFRNARWVGARLPDFLRTTPPWSGDPLVCGLAALEAALAQSFDAKDETPLAIEILGVANAEDWPRLRFGFHASVVIVATNEAALAAYEAAQAGQDAPALDDLSEIALVVWRRELEVHYRALDPLEALALRETMAGAPFGDICSMLAFSRPERGGEELAATAGGFLARWFVDGMIVRADASPA